MMKKFLPLVLFSAFLVGCNTSTTPVEPEDEGEDTGERVTYNVLGDLRDYGLSQGGYGIGDGDNAEEFKTYLDGKCDLLDSFVADNCFIQKTNTYDDSKAQYFLTIGTSSSSGSFSFTFKKNIKSAVVVLSSFYKIYSATGANFYTTYGSVEVGDVKSSSKLTYNEEENEVIPMEFTLDTTNSKKLVLKSYPIGYVGELTATRVFVQSITLTF